MRRGEKRLQREGKMSLTLMNLTIGCQGLVVVETVAKSALVSNLS